MQFRNQAILLLVASLSYATTAFVASPAQRSAFGLTQQVAAPAPTFSTSLFSEAEAPASTEEPVVAAAAAAPAAAPAEAERFTVYVSNVPFGKF